jgi:hypothetical protein
MRYGYFFTSGVLPAAHGICATSSHIRCATGKLFSSSVEDFHHELQTVRNTAHENLVRLNGWCGKVRVMDGRTQWKRLVKVELLLVFEFMPNGDLEHHLHKSEQVLSWEKRYVHVQADIA